MKKLIGVIKHNLWVAVPVLLVLTSLKTDACTTFSLMNSANERVFSKAFDWDESHALIVVNKRNVEKTALKLKPGNTPAKWVSKYGSITFNQHAREMPLGGMNEAGLVVEIMVGPANDIPSSSNYDTINEAQFIQYMLDNFANVQELIEGIQEIRIERIVKRVHYLSCDKNNDCVTIEFLDGRLVTHTGNQMPTKSFTNSSYVSSIDELSKHVGFGGTRPVPSGTRSKSRFVRAATAVKNFDAATDDSLSYSLDTLDNVSINGLWRIVYKGDKIFYRTKGNRNVRQINMSDFDFSCSTKVKIANIDTKSSGNILASFNDYTTREHGRLVDQNRRLPFWLKMMLKNYPDRSTSCLD